MIPKSGTRFSDKIMLKQESLSHDSVGESYHGTSL